MKRFVIVFSIMVFWGGLCDGQSWVWGKQATAIGPYSWQEGFAVATDSIGNVFETGCYSDTAKFGMDSIFPNSHSLVNVFLVKYDSSGNTLWAKGSWQNKTTQPMVYSVNADNKGNSYITGYYNHTISFGSDTLNYGLSFNAFYVKYDPSGNVLWAKTAIPASSWCNISGHSGCPDNMGNSYLTGTLEDTATFGAFTLFSPGKPTLFLTKYDINGNVLWA
jgi:hypothetical protein